MLPGLRGGMKPLTCTSPFSKSRAVLVGARTFGKGVVQNIYRWENLDFALRLTTAHYYTPNGRSLSRHLRRREDGEYPGGVEPDVEVALPKDEMRRINVTLF